MSGQTQEWTRNAALASGARLCQNKEFMRVKSDFLDMITSWKY